MRDTRNSTTSSRSDLREFMPETPRVGGGTEPAQGADSMQKLILVSVLLATFILPAKLGRRETGGEYAAVLQPFLAFAAVYVLLLLFVYPRLF